MVEDFNKYLILLKEIIYEYQMEKLAEDPKLINRAYQMLIKTGSISESSLMRKFKISSTCARKLIQGFKDKEFIDRFGRMIEHVVEAT